MPSAVKQVLRGGLRAAVVAMMTAGCGGGAQPLEWQVQFDSSTARETATRLHASILSGTCAGAPVFEVSVPVDGDPPDVTPPDLEPGRYAFRVIAVDDDCNLVAQGCEAIDLPQEEPGAVVVALLTSGGGPVCDAAEECVMGDCVGMDAGPRDGGVVDGGVRDAALDGFVSLTDAAPLECDEGTADCNLFYDDGCEVTLGTLDDCAGCGDRCFLPHASATCEATGCAILECDEGWANCDGVAANGCETSTRTLTDCGGCGVGCDLAQAGETCATGTCALGACHTGYDDCDGDPTNGCEVRLGRQATCASCTNTCGATQVCSADACIADPGVGVCPAGLTRCGASCVAVATDPRQCGACGNQCDLPHANAGCSAGACTIAACDPGWADCDANAANGCETSTQTTTSCGGCAVSCAAPSSATTTGAVVSCATGTCQVDACADPVTADCDGLASNGCEASLTAGATCGSCDTLCAGDLAVCGVDGADRACLGACRAPAPDTCGDTCVDFASDMDNCGGCGEACDLPDAVGYCDDGDCIIVACPTGRASCDGDASNGCETVVSNDPESCGGCGVTCPTPSNATATCAGGACGFACLTGFGDCDGDASNGCEQALDTLEHCGTCGRACAPANAVGDCSTGTCRVGSCVAPFLDCDSAIGGCETNRLTDDRHCGTCGNRCTGPMRNCCDGSCCG